MATKPTKKTSWRRCLTFAIQCTLFLSLCSQLPAASASLDKYGQLNSTNREERREAFSANVFLSSLGVNVHVSQGYNVDAYVEPLKYLGVRNIRDSAGELDRILMLHQNAGVKVDLLLWCDLESEMRAAERLASVGALLAVEGPNEPNNFRIEYLGKAGGRSDSWLPVAQCQEAIHQAMKDDLLLQRYPVFAVSEGGAEPINVGLQFLKIPAGAAALMPDGTTYADYANTHSYVSSTNPKLFVDNQAWSAADPLLDGAWDGLYAGYGRTWLKGFPGYSADQLRALPRVTTETGWDSAANPGGQAVQGKVLVNTYLAQFKRGWAYTFIYELVDNEGSRGEQGLYTKSYEPKLAAKYIHNLTSILADSIDNLRATWLNYSIPDRPDTVHDLLLQKASGTFELVVWGEQVAGSKTLKVNLGNVHRSVNVYDVTVGTAPVAAFTDVATIDLVVGDHAMIVEVAD
jgi:hypothetical protein